MKKHKNSIKRFHIGTESDKFGAMAQNLISAMHRSEEYHENSVSLGKKLSKCIHQLSKVVSCIANASSSELDYSITKYLHYVVWIHNRFKTKADSFLYSKYIYILCIAIQKCSEDSIKLLLDNLMLTGQQTEQVFANKLIKFCYDKLYKAVRDSGCNLSSQRYEDISAHLHAMHYTLIRRLLSCMKLMCDKFKIDFSKCINKPRGGNLSNTILHCAVKSDKKDVVALLLEYGALPNVQNNEGETPLHCCSVSDNVEIAKLLFGAGADLRMTDNYGQIPLHIASYCCSVKMVEFFLENYVDPNKKCKSGMAPIHSLFCDNCCKGDEFGGQLLIDDEYIENFTKISRLLSKDHPSINSKDADGNTPLNLFLLSNKDNFHVEGVQKLLKHFICAFSPDPLIMNRQGDDAFAIVNKFVTDCEFITSLLNILNHSSSLCISNRNSPTPMLYEASLSFSAVEDMEIMI